MTLDVPMLVPSALSLCCVAGTRPSWRTWVPALVMMAAMVIAVLPARSAGAVLLAGVVVIASAGLSLRRWAGHRMAPMDVHRAMTAIVMGGLILLSAGTPSMNDMHHGSSTPAVLQAGVTGYLIFTCWLLITMCRTSRAARCVTGGSRPQVLALWRQALTIADVGAMGTAVLMMAAM